MSDFAQAGSICTLQRLNDHHLPALEAELAGHAAGRPIALILPCHASELGSPALRHLCQELRGAHWLSQIVVSLNGLDAAAFTAARRIFGELPQPVRLLWTDAAPARESLGALLDRGAAELPLGKGLNVWAALGLLCAEGRAAVAVTQDCDVASFRRESLARLCAPCVHPRLPFAFAKMYYSRVTDRLYGRVSRLFFAPLLQAILRVAGHLPLLDFLLAFRYPLAGECALALPLARDLPCDPGWGLETAMLCEVFRHAEPEQVCQVDGGAGYDHKHQPALADGGLVAMCGEIARAGLTQLAAEGCTVDGRFRSALLGAYRREGAQALRRSEALALMNGLPFDAAAERAIVEAFASQLATEPGRPRPPLPAWSRLLRERPADAARFLEAADRTSASL